MRERENEIEAKNRERDIAKKRERESRETVRETKIENECVRERDENRDRE